MDKEILWPGQLEGIHRLDPLTGMLLLPIRLRQLFG